MRPSSSRRGRGRAGASGPSSQEPPRRSGGYAGEVQGLSSRRSGRLGGEVDGNAAGGIALIVVLAGAMLAGVAVTTAVAAADYLSAAARARTAADAAALAAAGASPLAGGDGDLPAAATRLARANGGHLRACCEAARRGASDTAATGGPVLRVEVAVAVAPRTALVRALAPEVTVPAAAALRPPEGFDGLAAAAARWPGRTAAPAGGDAAPSGALPPAGRGTPRMTLPAAGPLTSPFGWRTHPILGTRRLHAGIDIGAPHGAPVRAAADGVVVSAGGRGGYGLTVEIDHGGGLTSLYAHQSRLTVAPGQRVSRGTVIGAVGSTGLSTGPHLHFEVRVDNRPRDPRGYL